MSKRPISEISQNRKWKVFDILQEIKNDRNPKNDEDIYSPYELSLLYSRVNENFEFGRNRKIKIFKNLYKKATELDKKFKYNLLQRNDSIPNIPYFKVRTYRSGEEIKEQLNNFLNNISRIKELKGLENRIKTELFKQIKGCEILMDTLSYLKSLDWLHKDLHIKYKIENKIEKSARSHLIMNIVSNGDSLDKENFSIHDHNRIFSFVMDGAEQYDTDYDSNSSDDNLSSDEEDGLEEINALINNMEEAIRRGGSKKTTKKRRKTRHKSGGTKKKSSKTKKHNIRVYKNANTKANRKKRIS